MEKDGIEPTTSCLQSRRSTWLSYIPKQAEGTLAHALRLGCLGFPEALTQAASMRGQQGSHVEKTGVEPVAFRVRGGRSSRTELHPLVVSITPELEP